jgi:serine/threonine-protein kinase
VAFDLRDELQKTLGDNYVIERELSPGGMSRLFLATESSLERKVVIKLLPPETASEVSAARFHREVLGAAKLQHPNILPVLTTGTTGDLFFYIMPYVAGESLRHRLAKGPFPVPEALRVVREIADALALAHSRGVVHRDIKPANILLQEGHAVVTDFGIARAVEASRMDTTAERLTVTGVAIGTPGYMAPEQLSGERDLDARADVYALAVVAYEMLAGKPPFERPTFQALVAAHLTEAPPPLSSVAPEVPPAISAVIGKALAKAPDDRYTSAAEFRDALDVPMTAAFHVAGHQKRRRTPFIVAAAGVIAAIGGLLYAKTRQPELNDDALVILPFTVRDAEPSMRQGMVDLLKDELDKAWIKPVPPSTYVNTFTGNADESSAMALARRVGAGLAVFGTVAGLGADSLSITAELVDVARARRLGVPITKTGAKDQFNKIVATLAVDLRKELGKLKPIGSFSTTWLEETNPTALRAFLVGEQFFRRSAWDSATAYYQRALDADTSFALAYRHAGLVVAWRRSTNDSISRAYLRAAGRFNHGLPRRDSLLITADSLRATLTAFESDVNYFASVRRLFQTLRTARDSFPSDPEVWYALGDAYWHYGDGPGLTVPEDTILAAFDKSISLDSGFTPSYIHAIEIGLTREGADVGLRYADRYLALDPTDEEADGIRVLASVLRSGAISGDAARTLDTLGADALQTAWMIARRWTDSAEVAVQILRLPMRGRRSSSAFISDPGFHRVMLVRSLAYRGHLTAAYEALGTNIGPLEADTFGILVALGGVPADTARAVFARWLRDRSIWVAPALPWWASRGDTLALLTSLARADSTLGRANTPELHRDWTYRTQAVRAYLSLARHTSDAAARFEELPDTLCMGCLLDRMTRARLLDSLGNHKGAVLALAERPHSLITPLEVAAAYERALVAEKVQQYDVAARAYDLVARAWAMGDPAPRARATQAAVKAEQLEVDRPQRGKLAPAPAR